MVKSTMIEAINGLKCIEDSYAVHTDLSQRELLVRHVFGSRGRFVAEVICDTLSWWEVCVDRLAVVTVLQVVYCSSDILTASDLYVTIRM
ncbi:hypothetical protein AVEN_86603-1 [Araneus ventricosus]|uniref:Uncharacterized protein n=1 Tax=Araneus ventricosus TaxID=182803 RepID=A0A4Y2J6W4_ARAVE|nr:hypothetical protein AVEN_86603-1 [Araneus ventricosus]